MDDKEGTGVLFINDKKSKDTDPTLRGHIIIQGQKYWVSAWSNHSEKVTGGRYFPLRAEPADDQPQGLPRRFLSGD